ncbi:MAG: NUDIX hydrolase [Gammaproteobacteria bacterium]|nr:NUDIX hydrolase [Gammaproteobacteria bacterium]
MAKHDNPWKTLSIRDIYDNRWIGVAEHQVTNPSGNRGIYGKVSFKNIACGIIPLDDEGNTWIIGQYRYTLDEYSWEIPMGGVALQTDLLAGAKRELQEETGLSASRWKQILKVHISNSITDEVGVVYVAEGLEYGKTAFDETEKLQIRKLPFTKLLQMTLNGEITDVLSVAGILKLAVLRS